MSQTTLPAAPDTTQHDDLDLYTGPTIAVEPEHTSADIAAATRSLVRHRDGSMATLLWLAEHTARWTIEDAIERIQPTLGALDPDHAHDIAERIAHIAGDAYGEWYPGKVDFGAAVDLMDDVRDWASGKNGGVLIMFGRMPLQVYCSASWLADEPDEPGPEPAQFRPLLDDEPEGGDR